MTDLRLLSLRLRALTIFRSLREDPVLSALREYLDVYDAGDEKEAVSRYATFVSRLFESGASDLSTYVKGITGDDENVYICAVGRGETPSPSMEACLENELETLQMVASLRSELLKSARPHRQFLPSFESGNVSLAEEYRQRCEQIGRYGYGIYARYPMFYMNSDAQIVPVRNPDGTRLSSLVDYKREQQILLENTKALLEGKPAANILLTGDAGTGKSSTVKAVVNELWKEGLRILEVRKDQLREIPGILDVLNSNPLKFILFIDDLSFQKDDDNYSALKAILEGSVSAKAQNVVIYATSNRRHLVKENFTDRDGSDVHRNDTMQEILSLSQRFGIQITFQRPDKKTYLDIVHHLAKERGVTVAEEKLDLLAERFALGRGGRSARAATQFIDRILAGTDDTV